MRFIILTLISVSIIAGQDYSCKINIPNSIVMEGNFVGSNFVYSRDNLVYESLVGSYIQAINDTGLEETSMFMTNESFVFFNGTTGIEMVSGWGWTLQIGDVVYSQLKLLMVQPCRKEGGVVFQHISDVFRGLKTLYPIPGMPHDPKSPYLCQGLVNIPSNRIEEILNIEYNHSVGKDKLLSFSQLTDESQLESTVKEFRPLQGGDKPLFFNPCEKTQVSKDKILSSPFEIFSKSILKHL